MLHQLRSVGVRLDRVRTVTWALGPVTTQFTTLWIPDDQDIALAFALVAALASPQSHPFMHGGP